ncbi:hypothetical protein ACHAXT_012528 [Thalassiosira profunda]
MGLRPSVKSDSSGAPAADASPTRDPPASPTFAERSSPPPPPPQREAWTASGQLLLNFHNSISRAINSPEMVRKCGRIAEDMSRAEEKGASQPLTAPKSAHAQPSHRLAEEYGAEASMIVENKSRRDALVRNKSVALGVFSFVALRSGRGLGAVVRKTIANRRAEANAYQFERHLKPDMSKSAAAEANQPSRLRSLFRVSLDATIATSITFLSGTFLFMPKPSTYIEDMAQLPLVEGKSVYAEMVCPPLLREYRRVLEKYGGRWPIQGATNEEKAQSDTVKPELTQEDVSLNVIRQFVENCSKRSKYERALLEERHALSAGDASAMTRMMRRVTGTAADDRNLTSDGKAKDDEEEGKLGTVSVPPPGVPEWVAVDLDLDIWSLVRDEEEDRAEGQGDESANR